MSPEEIRRAIAVVPDFPDPGVSFQDLTPVFADPRLFRETIRLLAEICAPFRPDALLCPESRGFIFGVPLALELNAAFVPVRKKGKLPRQTHRVTYDMEYGPRGNELHMHADAVASDQRVLIVDDVLATGGTAGACAELAARAGAAVVGAVFALEIPALRGREKLGAVPIRALFEV